jgi:hypothetical protein
MTSRLVHQTCYRGGIPRQFPCRDSAALALYEIENDIRGQTADQRRRAPQRLSRPLVEAMFRWLNLQLSYAFNHRQGLILFLDDGRLELAHLIHRAEAGTAF